MTNHNNQGAAYAAGPAPTPRIGFGAIVAFVVIACALAWLVAAPMWLSGGLANPLSGVLIPLMMFTPAVAAVIAMLLPGGMPRGQRLRMLGMWPLRPAKRVVWMMVIGLFLPVVIVMLSVVIAGLFGWLPVDLAFSGYAEALAAAVPDATPMPPVALLVVLQLLSIPFAAATVNAVLAFGEELGWRGFLVPALRRYGTWASLLLSGAIWGVWHAPVILLGYNFGRTDITGVLLMIVGCVFWGIVFGWLRLRSASVWPAVFAHGALNASAGITVLVAAAGAIVDPALASALGVAGWIACALVIVVLLLTGQLRRQPDLAGAVAR